MKIRTERERERGREITFQQVVSTNTSRTIIHFGSNRITTYLTNLSFHPRCFSFSFFFFFFFFFNILTRNTSHTFEEHAFDDIIISRTRRRVNCNCERRNNSGNFSHKTVPVIRANGFSRSFESVRRGKWRDLLSTRHLSERAGCSERTTCGATETDFHDFQLGKVRACKHGRAREGLRELFLSRVYFHSVASYDT